MRKVTTFYVALFFTFIGFNLLANTQKSFNEVKDYIHELIAKNYLLGVTAAYIQPSGEVQYFSFGKLSYGKSRKPDRNTIYEIGSVSKTFTSLTSRRFR